MMPLERMCPSSHGTSKGSSFELELPKSDDTSTAASHKNVHDPLHFMKIQPLMLHRAT